MIQHIHEKALVCAKNYKRAEAELLEILQRIDDCKVIRAMGYPSLFVYAVSALKLSESLAYQFIGVARKSKEVPELKAAVANGEITVSTARRVVPVINKTNQEDWINKAKSLTQRTLEFEVVKESPKELIKERIRPVAESRLEMKLGISLKLDKKLARIKDLLAQKNQKPVSLEEVLDMMADTFLERHDPVQRAKRLLARTVQLQKVEAVIESSSQRKPPARIIHEVNLRDQSQCTYLDPQGVRCTQTRWTQIHHVKPFSKGGRHLLHNLQTLCFHHHRKTHEDIYT